MNKKNINILVMVAVITFLMTSCLTTTFGTTNNKTMSLLDIAKSGTFEEVSRAIDNGAEIDERNMFSVTPLMLATANKDPRVAIALIAAGANVNIEALGSYTPLFYAVEINRNSTIEIIDALVKAGADIEHKNYKGQTVLLYAAEMNNSEDILSYLIDLGANTSAVDNNGNDFEYYKQNSKNGVIN